MHKVLSVVFAMLIALGVGPEAFGATNPVFLSYGVSPASGIKDQTWFEWTCRARNADGAAIAMSLVILNPENATVSFPMAYVTGSGTTTSGASFRYSKTLVATGTYRYYFVARTNSGGYSRYPTSGFYSGPVTSTPAALKADLITSWGEFPEVAVLGRSVTLAAQMKNVGAASAGASSGAFVISAQAVSGTHTDERVITTAVSVGALAPNASSNRLQATWTPDQPGIYYLSFRADRGSQVAESNEGNNYYNPWARVVVGAPITTKGVYEVGVVVIAADALTDANLQTYVGYLEKVRRDIAQYRPQRQAGSISAYTVVQFEVRWNLTQTYDFSWHKRFAAACKEKGILWTPLLSFHHVPDAIKTKYKSDELTALGSTVPLNVYGKPDWYLKHSPSSKLWEVEAAAWVRAFVKDMAASGHLWPSGPIREILVGNEMMFPTDTNVTSADSASREAWKRAKNSAPFPTSMTPEFTEFRGAELARALTTVVNAAKTELRAFGRSDIPVSTKLVPYKFYRQTDTEQAKGKDRQSGYTVSGLASLKSAIDVAAIDAYPKLDSGVCRGRQWRLTDDYDVTRAQLGSLPIYLTEFNVHADDCRPSKLSDYDVYAAFTQGIPFGLRYMTLFAFNVKSGDTYFNLDAEQLRGLRLILDTLVP